MSDWKGTIEAAIFLAGVAMTAALIAELCLFLAFAPEIGRPLLAAQVVDAFTGKEAGIPVAQAGGVPWWLVAQVSSLQHLATASLVFPLFLHLLHRHHDSANFFMRRLRRIEAAAEGHKAFVRRWGPLGVFLFMLVPFLVNGPLVGAILGRLVGIRTRFLILPVIAATVLSSLVWAYSFHTLNRFVERVDPRLPYVLAGVVVLLVVGLFVLDEVKHRRLHHPPPGKQDAQKDAAEDAPR